MYEKCSLLLFGLVTNATYFSTALAFHVLVTVDACHFLCDYIHLLYLHHLISVVFAASVKKIITLNMKFETNGILCYRLKWITPRKELITQHSWLKHLRRLCSISSIHWLNVFSSSSFSLQLKQHTAWMKHFVFRILLLSNVLLHSFSKEKLPRWMKYGILHTYIYSFNRNKSHWSKRRGWK